MKTIAILGMHRSGTSCLTGCLQQMGLNLGKVSDFNEYNLKGNKEDDKIAILNENILNHNGGSWRNPPSEISCTSEHKINRDNILNDYAKLPSPVGFKDPRMLFTLPFWQQKLPNLKFLGSFRHPINVAKSLHARKNIKIEMHHGLNLWKRYNLQLLKIQKIYHFDLINFDLDPNEYLNQLFHKAKKLKLKYPNKSVDFFDQSLRNQKMPSEDLNACPEDILNLYNKLLKISQKSTMY